MASNTNHGTSEKRTFEFASVKELPGTGRDLISGAVIHGGLVLCGWDENRECWHGEKAGMSLVVYDKLRRNALIFNAAAGAQRQLIDQLMETATAETALSLLASTVKWGVRAATAADHAGQKGLVLHPGISDRKRKFSKDERVKGGRHAGKPEMVFKPKKLSTEGMIDLLSKFGPMLMAEADRDATLSFYGEQTPHMQKQGFARVKLVKDVDPDEVRGHTAFRLTLIVSVINGDLVNGPLGVMVPNCARCADELADFSEDRPDQRLHNPDDVVYVVGGEEE